jgi:aspartate/methionine/tyrosine aminotransferase
MSELYGREIDIERVSVTASGMSGIMMLFQCLLDAGDNAIITCPVWPNAQSVVRALGAEARFHALDRDPDEGWRLDVEALKAKCDARTRAIFVNSGAAGRPDRGASRLRARARHLDPGRRGLWPHGL